MSRKDFNDHRLGVALIGSGMVASAHARALQELQNELRVCGVYSRSEASRQRFLDMYAFDEPVKAYASVEEVANDPSVDMAIILTPPNARLDIVDALAAAGKHILTEKPIERSTLAAEEIVAMCARANVALGVVFQYRMRAGAKVLSDLISSGEFGSLAAVEIYVPWWREQSYYDEPGRGEYARDGGGVLISQAIHTLDLALSFTGPVETVQSLTGTTSLHHMEAEDFVSAGLEFSNGALGTLTASTACYPGRAEQIYLHFANASAQLEGETLTVFWRDGRREEFGTTRGTGGGANPMAFPHEWHREIISDFASAVRHGREPVVSGAVGLRVHRLIDALVKSSQEQRAVTLTVA
jgi:UDP-N-acetyl-2-amino-2-deoxyglucuronate dehydrogenase